MIAFRAILLACLLAFTESQAPAPTTYSGYLVDNYCRGQNRAGSPALDGTNVINDPSQHTIHCLRTPSVCRNGYYLAARNPSTLKYDIGFVLDEVGNDRAKAVLDFYTPSHPRYRQGLFTVTAIGMADGVDGFLRNAEITECNPGGSAQCDTVCNSTGSGCNNTAGGVPDVKLQPPLLLWGHVLCMLISWGCLLPAGVLWAHNLRNCEAKPCGTPIWFQGHRILQSVGWLFQLLGFTFIFLLKGVAFHALHERLGLFVVIVGSLQPLNAQVRHLACIGHPEPGEEKTLGRFIWEVVHKGLGYSAVLGGAVNIILGILFAMNIGFAGALIPIAMTFAAISLGGMLIVGAIAEVLRCFEKDDEEEEEEADGEEKEEEEANDDERTPVMQDES